MTSRSGTPGPPPVLSAPPTAAPGPTTAGGPAAGDPRRWQLPAEPVSPATVSPAANDPAASDPAGTASPDPATEVGAGPGATPAPVGAAWGAGPSRSRSTHPSMSKPDPATPPPVGRSERLFPVDLPEMLIGRRDDRQDIRPEIPIQDPAVSRRHAQGLLLPPAEASPCSTWRRPTEPPSMAWKRLWGSATSSTTKRRSPSADGQQSPSTTGPEPRQVGRPMSMSMVDIDRSLAAWQARLQRIDDNLVALETNPSCMLLERAGESGLEGVTQARVVPRRPPCASSSLSGACSTTSSAVPPGCARA